MSQMQQAHNLMLQNLMNNMWPTMHEDLSSNPNLPAKLSSPISPNCMLFKYKFMNIAHLYANYSQKYKLSADYIDSSTMLLYALFNHNNNNNNKIQYLYSALSKELE